MDSSSLFSTSLRVGLGIDVFEADGDLLQCIFVLNRILSPKNCDSPFYSSVTELMMDAEIFTVRPILFTPASSDSPQYHHIPLRILHSQFQ